MRAPWRSWHCTRRCARRRRRRRHRHRHRLRRTASRPGPRTASRPGPRAARPCASARGAMLRAALSRRPCAALAPFLILHSAPTPTPTPTPMPPRPPLPGALRAHSHAPTRDQLAARSSNANELIAVALALLGAHLQLYYPARRPRIRHVQGKRRPPPFATRFGCSAR